MIGLFRSIADVRAARSIRHSGLEAAVRSTAAILVDGARCPARTALSRLSAYPPDAAVAAHISDFRRKRKIWIRSYLLSAD